MNQHIEALAEGTRTIHSITAYIRAYVEEHYQSVFDREREHLSQIFAQVGEPAYGTFGRLLFQPLGEQLRQHGILTQGGLPGTLQNSLERWGPPEDRERCLWTTLHDEQGAALGTVVTRLFHDHTRFRLPRPPRVFALQETDPSAILDMLSHASVRAANGYEQRGAFLKNDVAGGRWEYSVEIGLADTLERGRAELTEGLLDHALATWGRYDWELVNVVSHQGQVLAFFKRPRNTSE